ncbi:MAG: aspartyl protease family protein [Phycisphaerales bacterium]|nr:aspartyl protease family protein [Phycisphaerales bacterium]
MVRPGTCWASAAALLIAFGCAGGARVGRMALPPDEPGAALNAPRRLLFEKPLDQPFEGYVNGRGPYRLGFDTGQSLPLLVTPEFAREHELPTIQRTTAGDGSDRNALRVDVARSRRFEVGGMMFRDVPTLVMDHNGGAGPEPTVGTVGFPLFAGRLLTLDYPANMLRVETGSLPKADGRAVVDYDAPQGLPVITIYVQGVAVRALIDSGSDAGLVLPAELASTLPLASPPEPAGRLATLFNVIELRKAPLLGSVWIGDVEFRDPVLTFADHFEEANLGRGYLKSMRITFDHANRRAHFEKPEPPAEPDAHDNAAEAELPRQ